MNNQAKNSTSKLAIAYKADQTREGSFFDKMLKLTGMEQMPSDLTLETTIIGAILLDKDAFQIVDFLSEQDFYYAKTKTLYKAFVQLHKKNSPIDMMTVFEQLRITNQLGGASDQVTPLEITQFTDKIASSANIEHHARILVQLKLRRQTIKDAYNYFKTAFRRDVDIFDLREKAHKNFITIPPVDLFKTQTATETIENAKNEAPRLSFADGLILEKEIVFIFGDNGSGKSVLSVQIAQAIASGEKLFGRLKNEVGPAKVLYFDFEVDSKGFAARYSNSDEGIKPTDKDYKYFPFHENFIRLNINEEYVDFEEDAEKEIFSKMERAIIKHEAKVIIVDNVSYLSTQDLENAKEAVKFMKKLLRLKNKYGVTIIPIAHNTKITRGLPIEKEHMGGSKQLTNLCDAVIANGKSSRESELRYIKKCKSRNCVNKYDTGNVIVTSVTKTDQFLHHEFINTEDETYHLEIIDKNDIEGIKQMAIEEWKANGLSPRKIKKKLNINQSHPTIRKWINQYKEEQAMLEQASGLSQEDIDFFNDKETPKEPIPF